jgi:hypothetical protein
VRCPAKSKYVHQAPKPGVGDERAHRGQHQDLQQERAAGPGIVVAVQLMVQAAVGPGDPHQRKDHRELAQPGPGQVAGQPVRGLGDQHHHGQVIEQFQRPDHALARLLAVRTRRLPQGAAQPSPALLHPVRLLTRRPRRAPAWPRLSGVN